MLFRSPQNPKTPLSFKSQLLTKIGVGDAREALGVVVYVALEPAVRVGFFSYNDEVTGLEGQNLYLVLLADGWLLLLLIEVSASDVDLICDWHSTLY